MTFILKSFILLFVTFFILRFISNKFGFLQSRFHNNHQQLIGAESIPLIGGLIFFLYILLNFSIFNHTLAVFSFLILLLGIVSDTNFLSSPKIRLLIQFMIICFFLNFFEYRIGDIRVDLLSELFLNNYFSFFFTAICILILVNGSNFIDGSNGLNLGYFFLVLIILQLLLNNGLIILENEIVYVSLIAILFLLLLNFFNYLYLGDSGAYLISFIIGSILIKIYHYNQNISPYFLALLLWYPAFENLFSIIRKKVSKINPTDPDTNHLHQLIFKYIDKKKLFFKKYSNQKTSFLIVLYNAVIFTISINYITKTNQIIILLMLNIIIYLALYFFIKKKLFK